MKYKLLWEDHFDVDGPVNDKYWKVYENFGGNGNNEDQYYTSRLKNVYCKDSILHLVGLKEDYKEAKYTSGKISTFGKRSIGYGKIEVMAKLPQGKGTWPAIWMLAESIHQGTRWPLCGEIDIMENVGRNPEQIHFSLHSQMYNHIINTQKTYFQDIKGILEGFHLFTMIWEETSISFYVDDIHYITFHKGDNHTDTSMKGWPFVPPYFLILNFAIGGNWGGKIDDSIFPQEFLIDYVRVFERID